MLSVVTSTPVTLQYLTSGGIGWQGGVNPHVIQKYNKMYDISINGIT